MRRAVNSLSRPRLNALTRSGYTFGGSSGYLSPADLSATMHRGQTLSDQVKRVVPFKWDLGSIITLIVLSFTMVWNFAHSNANLEQMQKGLEQVQKTAEANRIGAELQANSLQSKVDRISDRLNETNINLGRVQEDVLNLRERLVQPPPREPPAR